MTTDPPASEPPQFPPETPPLLDPAAYRYPRLTPNLREMITGWAQNAADTQPPMTDLLASPDPQAAYTSMTSPFLRDFYPQTPRTPIIAPAYDPERMDKMRAAHEAMNALFADDIETRSENNQPRLSNVTSPDNNRSASTMPSHASPAVKHTVTAQSRKHYSQTSSETPPPQDTSSVSPTSSPALIQHALKRAKQAAPKRRKPKPRPHSSSITSEKAKRPPQKPPLPTTARFTTAQPSLPVGTSATAIIPTSAMAINSTAVPRFFPFAPMLQPGISPHMFTSPSLMYQGRPMTFFPGAQGPELIPIDLLQAAALQYGAAQAAHSLQAAQRLMHVAPPGATPARPQSLEPLSGSRKKRRRQLLERSGCSEEEARQNRARALKRLRQKKTYRSQQNTVRYACRKRIALVRPRVNGRFCTKEELEQSQQHEREDEST